VSGMLNTTGETRPPRCSKCRRSCAPGTLCNALRGQAKSKEKRVKSERDATLISGGRN
jgi:hypothetical protein